ncbi:hypothetical protein ABK040_009111 [Willaertia magna]
MLGAVTGAFKTIQHLEKSTIPRSDQQLDKLEIALNKFERANDQMYQAMSRLDYTIIKTDNVADRILPKLNQLMIMAEKYLIPLFESLIILAVSLFIFSLQLIINSIGSGYSTTESIILNYVVYPISILPVKALQLLMFYYLVQRIVVFTKIVKSREIELNLLEKPTIKAEQTKATPAMLPTQPEILLPHQETPPPPKEILSVQPHKFFNRRVAKRNINVVKQKQPERPSVNAPIVTDIINPENIIKENIPPPPKVQPVITYLPHLGATPTVPKETNFNNFESTDDTSIPIDTTKDKDFNLQSKEEIPSFEQKEFDKSQTSVDQNLPQENVQDFHLGQQYSRSYSPTDYSPADTTTDVTTKPQKDIKEEKLLDMNIPTEELGYEQARYVPPPRTSKIPFL